MDNSPQSPAYIAFKARVEENALLASLFLMLSIRLRNYLLKPGTSTKTFGPPMPMDEPEHQRMLEQHVENFETVWKQLLDNPSDSEIREAHNRFINEVIVTRTVDALEAYLGAMLTYIFTTQPEHLTDEDRRQLEGLTGRNRTAKIEALAERRAGNLTGGGMDAIIKYLNNKMKTRINTKGDDLYAKANEYINVRHIIVHADLKVTPRFLERTQRLDLAKGQPFPLTDMYARKVAEDLFAFVAVLDTILIERLHLFADERKSANMTATG